MGGGGGVRTPGILRHGSDGAEIHGVIFCTDE